MKRNLFAAALGAAALAGGAAFAEYPERPIQMVIPFSAGGATDLSARAIAGPLGQVVPQPIVLTNRVGAGGATGSVAVKDADGDGYTMLFARVGSHTVNPAMNPNLPYSLDDFRFVGVYEINPVICAVSADSDIESMDQLVQQVNDAPGTVLYTSSGVGTLLHIAAVMVLDAWGVEDPIEQTVHLPMDGGGVAATAVFQGTATFICTNSSALASFINNGQLRPLLVTTPERLEGFEDVPTVGELGYPELEQLVGWTGVAGPADLSDEAAEAWQDWLAQAVEDEGFQNFMRQAGSQVRLMSPQESVDFVQQQYETFRNLVVELDLEIE